MNHQWPLLWCSGWIEEHFMMLACRPDQKLFPLNSVTICYMHLYWHTQYDYLLSFLICLKADKTPDIIFKHGSIMMDLNYLNMRHIVNGGNLLCLIELYLLYAIELIWRTFLDVLLLNSFRKAFHQVIHFEAIASRCHFSGRRNRENALSWGHYLTSESCSLKAWNYLSWNKLCLYYCDRNRITK